MSTFLMNLARRGAGLHQNVQPRVAVGVNHDLEAKDFIEVGAKERSLQPDESAPHTGVGGSAEMVENALRNGEQSEHSRIISRSSMEATSISASLDEPGVHRRSEFQTAQHDIEVEPTGHRLPRQAQSEGPTQIRDRKRSPHNHPDIAVRMTSQEEPAPAPKARPDQPNPLGAGSFSTERNNLDAEPRVGLIMARERHLVGEPPVTKAEKPGPSLRLDARSTDDGLGPASNTSRLEPRTQDEQAGTAVARPPLEKFSFPVDRGIGADPSSRADRQIDGLIDRLGALIDRLEADQKASQQSLFPQTLQSRLRPPARGFSELASLRRHVDRRWY